MEWENKVIVVDDVLPKMQQENLIRILLGPQFPWHFTPDVTGGGGRDGRPAFNNRMINDGKVHVPEDLLSLISQLINNSLSKLYEATNVKASYELSRTITILQMPLANLAGSKRDAHHIDFKRKHLNIVYYVLDADGDTVIFENMYHPNDKKAPEPNELKVKKKVTPKQGRAVIFDGYHWHTGTQPQKGLRCIINNNVMPK